LIIRHIQKIIFVYPNFIYQNVYQSSKEIRQPFILKVVYDASCICDHQNLGKSIRQVLQTIIIDVVQRCPILPESAYYSRRQREMLKDIHEYIIQTFNMLYAERLIWYCFGALDLTFNPWGTLYKIKTTCVFMFTFKHKKNTKENRRS